MAPATIPLPSNHIPTLVYAGGMGKGKGVDLLVEAVNQLWKNRMQFKLLLIGQTPAAMRTELENMGDCVKFIEQVPYHQLQSYLQQADIGIDPKPPSTTESSGKILDYMAAGLAVVAFNSPTTLKLINDVGVLVPTASAAALAGALAKLISDHQRIIQLATGARQRVQQQFLWEKLFLPVLHRYDHLVKSTQS